MAKKPASASSAAAKKKTKAANRDVPIDHNKTAAKDRASQLTPDERAVLHFQWRKKYEAALAEKKAAATFFLEICKKARVDLGEDAVAEIKDSVELGTPEGEARFKKKMTRYVTVAKMNNLEIGTMDDLFGDLPPTQQGSSKEPNKKASARIEKAKLAGKKVGLEGGNETSNPYDPGSPEGQGWIEAYRDGQAVNMAKIKEKASNDQAFEEADPAVGETEQVH